MRTNLTLIDSIIVLLAGSTLSLFLLWSTGELLGLEIFTDPPDFLKSVASHIFAVVTGGSVLSLILYTVRIQINKDLPTPNYILYIIGLSTIFIILIFLIAHIIKKSNFVPDRSKRATATSVLTEWESDHWSEGNYEFEIDGPFFSKELTHKLIIKARITPTDEIDRVFFLRNFKLLGEYTGCKLTIQGICHIKYTDRIAVILTDWDGSATTPERIVIISYDVDNDKILIDSFDGLDEPVEDSDLIECQEGQAIVKPQGQSFIPCNCTLERFTNIRSLIADFHAVMPSQHDFTIDSFPDSFFKGKPFKLASKTIDSEPHQFDTIIQTMELLCENAKFTVDRFSSERYELIQVIYYRPIYESFGYIFFRDADFIDGKWKIIYEAGVSSKGFHPVDIEHFVNPSEVELIMCVKDCNWWGSYARVRLDLDRLEVLFVGES